ncbi:MAG: M28 family peptidase [Gemmatimonadetes bacterium]|nr:M28 family peptidase [Gemmatimonadota bacterium]
MISKRTVLAAALFTAAATVYACASAPVALNQLGNPPKLAPRPTAAPISESDLRTRLYIFADDSMQGRQYGRVGNMKGTDYIARELARMGVEPAGDNGTYFQEMPVVQRRFARTSTLSVGGRALRWVDDWIATPGTAAPRSIDGAKVIFGGVAGDTASRLTAEQANGKIVVMLIAQGGGRGGRGGGGGRGGNGNAAPNPLAGAVAIATVNLDNVSMGARAFVNDDPQGRISAPASELRPPNPNEPQTPPQIAVQAGPPQAQIRLTNAAAAALLGAPLDGMRVGTEGPAVSAKLDFVETPVPQYARNVVGIIRGSDPAMRNSYVAVGAHPDHVGFSRDPVDHDSLQMYNAARQAIMNKGGDLHTATPAELAGIKLNLDSVRKIRPPRLDSIRNGADDDGSGSMALLEIAEAVSAMPVKPKRSLLFVWNNGEEAGLTGSAWYTMHPTVPRDSIVAQINVDMIGRGRAADIPGGGDDYLAVIGSQRLSADIGQSVVASNLKQAAPFRLDYRFDSTTTWPGYNNIYGRSDHANYARFNIPIAFFFTGLHADYHQLTDEPQYIDYPHYARITQYIGDVVIDVANRDKRPALYRP